MVVGPLHRHQLDTGGDALYCLDFRLPWFPAPLPELCALSFCPSPRAPSCLLPVAQVTLPLLASGPPPRLQPVALVRSLPPAPLPVSRVPPSVTRALAFSAGAVPCVPPSAARALDCPVCLPSTAAACTGALPVPLPSLVAASALAIPLCPSPGAAARAFTLPCRSSSFSAYHPPSVALRPSRRAPVAGTPPRLIGVPPHLDHTPLQLRQCDAYRRALGRSGAEGPWPPLEESGLGRVRFWGAHVVVA